MLQDLFGIELPIIQAPMAGAQDAALAIAVSNAGGLGSLPCGMLGIEAIRSEADAIRRSTAAPFNLNFLCHAMPAPDAAKEAAWRAALRPYFDELGLDESAIPATPPRTPFSEAHARLVAELRPPTVSFHFGLPRPPLLAAVKAAGAKVLSSATTVEEAVWLEANGADAVIAQGLEAGGHRSMFLSADMSTQLGTLALVPQIVQAVRVPVIAAGGIADARGVAAALALGTAGVQVGTAYLLCPEARISAMHRTAIQSEAAASTVITNLLSGRPARGILNRLIRELGPISALAPEFPLAGGAISPLRAAAEAAGSGDFSPLWCGQNASGCQPIPAAELTRSLAARC